MSDASGRTCVHHTDRERQKATVFDNGVDCPVCTMGKEFVAPPPSTQDGEKEKRDLGITEPSADHVNAVLQNYRKRPVVIQAIQFGGTPESACAVFRSFDIPGGKFIPSYDLERGRLSIPTSEGVMTASKGDWIIRGVKGEVYPCKPDIFEATYECAAPSVALETDSDTGPCLQSQIPIVTPAVSTQNTVKGQKELARYFLMRLESTRDSCIRRYEEI